MEKSQGQSLKVYGRG